MSLRSAMAGVVLLSSLVAVMLSPTDPPAGPVAGAVMPVGPAKQVSPSSVHASACTAATRRDPSAAECGEAH
jgi:hypothetical protein